jgi:DNA-binding transcriptional LysR family regulator
MLTRRGARCCRPSSLGGVFGPLRPVRIAAQKELRVFNDCPIPGLRRKFGKTRFQITSQTSIDIQRELDDFTIDVGLTYLDNDPLSRVRTVPLYRERYALITHEASGFSRLESISWAKAATLPLCLLTPSMQNRRIIDTQFRAAGAQVNAVMETNSLVTLWTHLVFGQWSTVNHKPSCCCSSKGAGWSPFRWSNLKHFIRLA